jgi:RNA polymerase sigma factor (sigma-70 family)
LNDSELVERLRAQDPEAVRCLTDRFLPSVWRFVFYRVSEDCHVAEDIVSESVLALIRAAQSEQEILNPGAWLRSVASHKILDHFRAATRVQHLMRQVGQASDGVERQDALAQQQCQERQAQIRQVMEELPEHQRLALEWKYVEKLSVREIAGRLSTTQKAAESMLFRARRQFRDKLIRASPEQDEPHVPVQDAAFRKPESARKSESVDARPEAVQVGAQHESNP